MIINVGEAIRSVQGLRAGLRYQLRIDPPKAKEPKDPTKVEVLEGDYERMMGIATSLSTSQKAIPILISFKESREELEKKLEEKGYTISDLYGYIRELLFKGYEPDEIICTAVAHSDTSHFHIHMYVLNSFAGTDRTLKLHFGKGARYLRAIEDFVNYGLGLEAPQRSSAISYSRKEELLRRLGKAEKYGRTALKEELHSLITDMVAYGHLRNAEDIRRFIETDLGGKVRRHGKNYMTVELAGHRIRLKGGVYDANFGGVERAVESSPGGTEEDKRAKLERAKEVLREYVAKRSKDIQERYGKIREELQRRDREAQARTPERAKHREREIPTHRSPERSPDRSPDRSVRHVEAQSYARNVGSDTGRGRRNLYYPRPKTLIRTIKEEAEAMGREAQKLKDTIDLRRLMSFLRLPFYYGETERGPYILARVPWREDRHPSFLAHRKNGRWLWYDLARREGGSVIDFVMKFFSAIEGRPITFKEALSYLKEKEEMIRQTPVRGVELESGKDTTHRIERINDPEAMEKVRQIWRLERIPPWLELGVRTYVQVKTRTGKDGEIESFQVEKEETLPVMVFTDADGNPRYWRASLPTRTQKGWLSQNEPILLEGKGERLYVVEGYTDALAIYQIDPTADILVLGTVENARRINPEFLRSYEKVYIATDNDPAGERAYEILKKNPKAVRLKYEGKDPMEAYQEGKLVKPIELDIDLRHERGFGFSPGL